MWHALHFVNKYAFATLQPEINNKLFLQTRSLSAGKQLFLEYLYISCRFFFLFFSAVKPFWFRAGTDRQHLFPYMSREREGRDPCFMLRKPLSMVVPMLASSTFIFAVGKIKIPDFRMLTTTNNSVVLYSLPITGHVWLHYMKRPFCATRRSVTTCAHCRRRHGGQLSPLKGQVPRASGACSCQERQPCIPGIAQHWVSCNDKVCTTGLRNRDFPKVYLCCVCFLDSVTIKALSGIL